MPKIVCQISYFMHFMRLFLSFLPRRFDLPAIHERDKASVDAQRGDRSRHREGAFRQSIRPQVEHEHAGGAGEEDLHTGSGDGNLLRVGVFTVRSY